MAKGDRNPSMCTKRTIFHPSEDERGTGHKRQTQSCQLESAQSYGILIDIASAPERRSRVSSSVALPTQRSSLCSSDGASASNFSSASLSCRTFQRTRFALSGNQHSPTSSLLDTLPQGSRMRLLGAIRSRVLRRLLSTRLSVPFVNPPLSLVRTRNRTGHRDRPSGTARSLRLP